MPQGNPKPGEIYRHFKNHDYQIIAIAHHSETDEPLVIYQGLYAPYKVCARPYAMFVSEVDHLKYPDVTQTWRFELIGEIADAVVRNFATGGALDDSEPKSLKEEPDSTDIPDVPQTEEPHADPWLIRFMDAESLADKIRIYEEMRPDITDRLIDEIAVVSDFSIDDGPLEQR